MMNRKTTTGAEAGKTRKAGGFMGADPALLALALWALIMAACSLEPGNSGLTPALTEITLNTEDVTTTYAVDAPFSSTGLVVTAHYNDNSAETVTDYALTWNNAPLAEESTDITAVAGTKPVTVTHGGKTAAFTITVNGSGGTPVLTNITLNTGDVKTIYTVGEDFTSEGLAVTALYSDGSTEPVTDYTLTWNNAPLAEGSTDITAAVGQKIVTVTYQDKTAEFTLTVGEAAPEVVTIDHLGASGPKAVLTVPDDPAAASTLVIGTGDTAYSDPASIGDLSGVIAGQWDGLWASKSNTDVNVTFVTNGTGRTVSLAYVHYVREAVKAAGGAVASVSAPADKFTPVFDGRDWWSADYSHQANKDLYAIYSSASVYSDFSSGGIEIMNGIKVFKHSGGKYMIAYDRLIKASEVALGVGNQYGANYSFHGLGLHKEANRSIEPVGNHILIHGGYQIDLTYNNNNIDFTTYKTLLEEAGLSPTSTMKPEHKVVISGPGTNGPNTASNGIYDFILAYYNPGADGTFEGSDLSARLPAWPTSGLTFDGSALPPGLSSRNIGGTTADSMSRKGARETSGTPATHVAQGGQPRGDFINNITVPMANYLVSSLHIGEFRNTNIVGDAEKWSNYSISQFHLIPCTNIGLIGNYSGVNTLSEWQGHGVLDIVGTLPQFISMVHDYYNLWSNVLNETRVNSSTSIVYLHGSGVTIQPGLYNFSHKLREFAVKKQV
jgi:hypothetical protein